MAYPLKFFIVALLAIFLPLSPWISVVNCQTCGKPKSSDILNLAAVNNQANKASTADKIFGGHNITDNNGGQICWEVCTLNDNKFKKYVCKA